MKTTTLKTIKVVEKKGFYQAFFQEESEVFLIGETTPIVVGSLLNHYFKPADLGIKVRERRDDFHVCLIGKEGIWGCGNTLDKAIGTLISDHPKEFGFIIDYQFKN